MKRSLVAWVVFCALALVAPAMAQRALSAVRPVVRRPRITFPALPGARRRPSFHAASLGQGSLSAVGYDAFGQATIPAEAQSHIRTLAAGDVHSLALRTDGTVVAWGDNSEGQATVPAGLNGVRAIGAGAYHSLAVKEDGTVVAWGNNSSGQTAVPAGLNNVLAVAGGSECSAALRSDGTVVVWGANDRGQRNLPSGLTGVKALAAGASHLLALKSDGTVVAWGGNNSGQATVPPGLTGVVSIAAGYFHSIALKTDGTIQAWGDNSLGQRNVAAVSGVRAIASAGLHSLALTAAGTLVGSGDNSFGQIALQGFNGVGQVACGAGHTLVLRTVAGARVWGDNASGQLSVPTGLGAVSTVAAGAAHCLALESTGLVSAWGANQNGQATVPPGLLGVTSIAAGSDFSLALKHDGTMIPWGSNAAGQTTLPGGLLGVRSVAAGSDFGLALRGNGTVTAWGGNGQGQATVPGDLAGVTEIAAGAQHALALKSDGTVTAWGRNHLGQATVPAGLTEVMAIAAGGDHSLALKSDGTVVAWGEDAAEVPDSLTGVIAIAAGVGPCLALKSDGTIVTWGDDLGGHLSPPPGLIGISAVSLGGLHGMAVLSPAPFVGALAPLNTLEDQPTAVVTIQVGDLDTPVGDLILTAAADLPGKVQSFELGGSGAVRTLRIIPAPNANGTVNVVVTASDGTFTGGASFPLTITPVNDAPTFSKGVDPVVSEDSGPQTREAWAFDVTGGPADEAAQGGTFFVTANTNPGLFSDAPAVSSFTGDLTFTPAENAHGTATLTLLFRDDGGTANGGINFVTQTFTITVTPVNDPPVPAPDSYAVLYSSTFSVSGNGILGNDTDVDGDLLTAAVAVSSTHGSLALNGNGSFTYHPVVGYSGPDSFTYTVSDGTVQSAPVTVTLEVGALPASTPNARVTGSGKVLVEGTKVSFTVQAANKRKLTGKLTFADRTPARKVKKATVTAVVVTGRHARVYGTAILGDGTTSPFAADLDDPIRGTGPDRFGLELGTGMAVPSTALSSGKITIKP